MSAGSGGGTLSESRSAHRWTEPRWSAGRRNAVIQASVIVVGAAPFICRTHWFILPHLINLPFFFGMQWLGPRMGGRDIMKLGISVVVAMGLSVAAILASGVRGV